MKISNMRFILINVLILFFCSCANSGIMRNQSVSDNVYTSNRPKIKVVVDKHLDFIDNFTISQLEKWPDFSDVVKYDIYVFGRIINNNLNKGVMIFTKSFTSSHAQWQQQCSRVEKAFVNNYVNINKRKYCNLVSFVSREILSKNIAKPLLEMGYKLNSIYLFNEYSILISGNRESFHIIYFETLENHFQSHRWGHFSLEMLSTTESERLSDFMTNSKNAIKFSEQNIADLKTENGFATQKDTIEFDKKCTGLFDGFWKGKMTTKGSEGANCADSGTFEGHIKDCEMTGQLVASNGLVFTIEGRIDSNGKVIGGIASNENNIGTFSGSFGENIGSGIWQDDFSCSLIFIQINAP